MEPYRDTDGDSGVAAYEIGDGFIRVKFTSGSVYLYTNASAGAATITQMKMLAQTGDGLSAYIARHVRDKFVKRET
jgi:hypothetical protein